MAHHRKANWRWTIRGHKAVTTRLLTKAAAARALGCSRPTIYDILEKNPDIFEDRDDGKVRECDLQAYMAGRNRAA